MARVLEDDSMFRFQSQFNLNVENNLRNLIYHDVLNLLSDPFLDNNQNLSFFSEFIFNSHYMFRHSGPDHMLLHTVLKQKGARLNFTFTCESKSKIQDKQKFTKILSWKKLIPSGATRLPPQLSLSSNVLMAPPCQDFSRGPS